MVSYVSGRIAAKIKAKVPNHPSSEKVLKYSISFLINTILSIVVTIIISLWTGKLNETLIVLCSFALLRRMSGGIHLKSSLACISVTSIGANLLSFASLGSGATVLINSVSLVLVCLLAPAHFQKKKKVTANSDRWLKVGSILLVALNFVVASPVIAATFFVQSLTLVLIKVRR